MPPLLDRLHPRPGRLTVPEALAELGPGARARADRPFVYLNMVASVDGRATLEGGTRGLGDDADLACLLELRTQADAVLVGTATLRGEGYGRLVRAPQRRARREAAGLRADPVAVVVTRSGHVPWEAALFASPEQPVLVYAQGKEEVRPPPWVAASVDVVAAGGLDGSAREDGPARDEVPWPRGAGGLATILADLRARGIRALLCEGGPTLNRFLLDSGLVDELFLTLAPVLVGDESAPTILGGGPLAVPARLVLRWVLRHGDELLLRYAVPHDRSVASSPPGP